MALRENSSNAPSAERLDAVHVADFERFDIEEIEMDLILFDRETGQVCLLDPVSAAIWYLLAGEGRRCSAVVTEIRKRFDIDPEIAQADVADIFSKMRAHGLLRVVMQDE